MKKNSMWGTALGRLAALGLVGALVLGCTDTETVFVDRPVSNPPPDAGSGLLGYFDAADKLTSCGNCHVGLQSRWEGTGHADAWAGLNQSSGVQSFCWACHTVSQNGNLLDVASGYDVVQSDAYFDVQCENCHGPGMSHVENPDASQPLASIAGNAGLANCAECHTGAHHPFAEEWAMSKHAVPDAYPAGREDCISCHTAQGALAAWGVNADYEEKFAPLGVPPAGGQLPITCATCHSPHGTDNSADLRFPIDVPAQDLNLCIKCHHKRAAPEEEAPTLRGPHSPEGPLLLGEGAGWFPPGLQPETGRILGSHGTTGNPRVCATCHVARFEVTDPVSGDFLFQATGHLFLAIPCVDAQGIPTTNQNCMLTERQWEGCLATGCHATELAAQSAYTTATGRIDGLTAQVDALLAQPAVAADFDRTDGVFTIADGAWFNNELAKLPGSPVHNPFLIEQLLAATITAVNDFYGPFPITVSLELEL